MHVQVDQEGVPTSLKKLAQVTVPEASTLLITPFDAKSSLKVGARPWPEPCGMHAQKMA